MLELVDIPPAERIQATVSRLQKSMQRKPDDMALHMRLADALLEAGRRDEAIAVLTDIHTDQPELQFALVQRLARTFEQEDRDLTSSLEQHVTKRYQLEQEMKALRSLTRRKAIRGVILKHYKNARMRLNLMSKDLGKMQVATRPDVSGSGDPREVFGVLSCALVDQQSC